MIEQSFIDNILAKAFDLGMKKANNFFIRMEEIQTFDLVCERLLNEYKEKFGEDILVTKFFLEGNERVYELHKIIEKQTATREIFSDIVGYIAEETDLTANDYRIVEFASMLISELMFMDEFRGKMREYRKDIELGEVNKNVKEMLSIMTRLIENIEKRLSPINYELHQLTNPPPKANELIHRNNTVAELQKLLETGDNILLVNGLGGIGKTSIARKVYHNVKDKYKHIVWIEYQENLRRSLLSSLFLFNNTKDENIRFKQIEQYITNSKEDTILFIDNVNKTVSEDPSLSVLLGINARIVITSRRTHLHNFTPINVGFLSENQCVDIFYEYYIFDKSRDQTEIVKDLVNIVSCHTLSVELLAKCANMPGYSLSKFLDDLKRKGFGYPELLVEANHSMQARTIAQHLIKLFELVNVSDEQKRILRNFAILPSVEIPADVKKWIECKSGDLMRLNELGWIRVTENGYTMPDIVKESIRMQIGTISINDYSQLLEYLSKDEYIKKTNNYIFASVRLKIADTVISEFKDESTEIMGKLLANIATIHNNQGQYDKALEYNYKALYIREKVLGKGHPDTATTYNNTALAYFRQGEYSNALEWHQKALSIREKVLGKEHPDTATTYDNIADVYYCQGEYPKAFEWYQKALAIREKVLGKEHPDTATSFNNIAGLYYIQGDCPKALEWYQNALSIREKMLGKEHPDTATTYSNFALVY